jgi:glutamine phosphoribosylpyrophosphate amidotransferase
MEAPIGSNTLVRNIRYRGGTQMLAKRPPGEDAQTPDWEGRIKSLMEYTSAAYSLVIMTKDSLIGVRDPFGFRPLCIGQIPPTVRCRRYPAQARSNLICCC